LAGIKSTNRSHPIGQPEKKKALSLAKNCSDNNLHSSLFNQILVHAKIIMLTPVNEKNTSTLLYIGIPDMF